MANDSGTEWETAIQAALDANEGTVHPKSLGELHRKLARLRGSTQTAKSWKSTVTDIRRSGRASEAHASLIAKALGVRRDELPDAAERLSLSVLERHLQELAMKLGDALEQQAKDRRAIGNLRSRVGKLEALRASGAVGTTGPLEEAR